MMDREQMPTVSWPMLGIVVAAPQLVGWLALGADYDPGSFAIGSLLALMGLAVMNTLAWLVRR